jgi:hypothetical protein
MSSEDGRARLRYRRIKSIGEDSTSLEPLSGPTGPALAAVHAAGGDRLAWLTASGVTLAQADSQEDFSTSAARPELSGLFTSKVSADPKGSQQWLRFDPKGDLLTLILLSERADVRVWNVSDERAARIRSMTSAELVEAACLVVANSDERETGSQLTDTEFDRLPVGNRKQPCQKQPIRESDGT